MSTDILRNYEQQFGILCAEITSKISKINENDENFKNSKDFIQLQNNIESLFAEARELIEQMELEIRDINLKQNFNNDQKQKYANIIKSYKSELSKLESEFKRRLTESKSKKERYDLFLTEDNDDKEDNLMKNNNEKIVKMNKTLENGYQISLESEEIGKTILNDLNQQREVIQRSRDRLRTTNNDLGQSSRLLSVMLRRLVQNKFLLFGLFIFLFIFTIFVVYLVVRRKF
jgi:vesicle transport through interaction with t-SNAREs protein 1